MLLKHLDGSVQAVRFRFQGLHLLADSIHPAWTVRSFKPKFINSSTEVNLAFYFISSKVYGVKLPVLCVWALD